MFLPSIRAGYRLIESYRPAPEAWISAPVTAYCGTEDPHVRPGEVLRWEKVTEGAFTSRVFTGGHVYLHERLPEVVGDMARLLGAEPICDVRSA